MGTDHLEAARRDPPARRVLVHLCGPVRIEGPAATVVLGRRQPQVVLAHLTLERGAVVLDRLAEAVWGEHLSPHWRGAVRGILSKLRTDLVAAGLDAGDLRIEAGVVRLAPDGGLRTDIDEADGRLLAAEAALDADRPAEALQAAAEVRAVTTQPFLVHHDDNWTRQQRRLLAERSAQAVHVEVAALTRMGRTEEASIRAREHLARQPLDERTHHLLVHALMTGGRRAAAVQAHDDLAAILADALGIAPDPATTALLDAAVPAHGGTGRRARRQGPVRMS